MNTENRIEVPLAQDLTSPAGQPAEPAPILSTASRHPLHLLWISVLPQALLLMMNLHWWWLVGGEMTEAQPAMAGWIGVAQGGILVAAGALAFVLHRFKRPVPLAGYAPLLAMAVGYLWLVMSQAETLIPASVSTWILPPGTFLYYQFTLMMPLAFFSAMQLACFPLPKSRRADVGFTVLVLIGVPVVMWFSSWLIPQSFGFVFVISIWVAGTLAFVAALMRLTVMSYVGARRKGPVALAIMTTLVALVAPIGGLLLNRRLPFPSDFQSPGVYALVVVNGLLLLLPNFRPRWLHRTVWLARCAAFPFTLYFFAVFLPFLPLSLLAIFVAGAGFLMLAPAALFILHGQRIVDGFRNEVRDGGRILPAVLGAAAVLAMPLGYTVQALRDRAVLGRALDYAYEPDYRAVGFGGSPATVGTTLGHLRDFKAGIQLPYISDYYNWLVFNGLVLPAEKISMLHRLFVGTELPEPSRRMGNDFFGMSDLDGRQRSSLSEMRTTAAPPSQDVRISRATPTTKADDAGGLRTRIALELENTSASESEFVTTLHVPEGVFISGVWLEIDGKPVPARIFEKKSALWVYQQIRDVTRRDPCILYYTGAETLEMRVFPVAGRETRKVELELLQAATAPATAQIGSQVFSLAQPEARVMVSEGAEGAILNAPASALRDFPTLTRRPYLHFIVDRSSGSALEGSQLRDAMMRLAWQFPTAQEYAITAANFDAAELTEGIQPLSTLAAWDARRLNSLPKRGGFAQDRVLKRVLLRAGDDLNTGEPAALGRFPIPVIMRGGKSELIAESDLEIFGKIAPDLGGYFVSIDGGPLTAHAWDPASGSAAFTTARAARAVVLFKLGSAILPALADGSSANVLPLLHGSGKPQVWNTSRNAWVEAPGVQPAPEGRYAAGIAAWLRQAALLLEPVRGKEAWRKLVSASRDAGVMVPATSYIVVENSAQWRKLEETEKKKLGANAALALQEPTPEPGTMLLLILGGGAWLARRRRSARWHA